ncbi:glycosyltransferase family 2 protein [Rhizobium sp. BK251]|uniref:glycosyltransferase family 2 protein n=1 Tax=Rhizobium sp. BK251 TaxID=2512125 RepID=UPI0010532882|nr:glycosyltransferase family 2 protein [Rhizobium sp. BK251]TCL74543.1 glycosyltransferase involved in cell wall biosynthesis [Rhizobium sp. BK251]
MSISVCILTLNEEENLPACLATLSWCDDIVVIDSYSTDRTVEIARAAGARVYQRAYDGEHTQRLYALKQINYKYPWVYMPDADEITPSELRDEMLAIAADASRPESFFRIRFKNMFMGRWIKHSSLYPSWIPRLFRPDRILGFDREVHLRCNGLGPEGRLNSHFIHYSFNKGMKAWYDKHNRYSSSEAKETAVSLRERRIPWGEVFSSRAEVRRRGLKELSMHVPFRATARFVYMYFLRFGFLDGMQGYHYCRLLAAYEYMIVIKTMELRRRERGLPV